MDDNSYTWADEPTPWEPPPPDAPYRPSIWAPDYNPGDQWNGGTPPPGATAWNMNTNSWDLAPPVREGTSDDNRNMIASTPTGGGGGGGGAPQGGGGYVPSMPAMGGSNINVPSATLPGDISSLLSGFTPQKTAVQTAYQDALLKYMSHAQETPSLSDSTLAPQVDVFRAGQQRSTERQRLANSERAAANGQSQSGYLDNLINQGVQQQGFNTASFNANLLGSEMGKRREELQAGLQLARATGDAEAQRELQTRLAEVNARMQQEALNLQGQLGSGDLALRLMQSQMGNNQFYDQLGINSQLSLESLNQSALQKILGGLNT